MSNKSPTLAAFLSFVFPGLGQIYAGQIRKGLIWAIPMFLLVIALLLLLLGGSKAVTTFLAADKALALVVFDIAFFLYHVAAMLDAYDVARHAGTLNYSRRTVRSAPIALAVLVTLTMLLHGLPGVYGYSYYEFASSQGGHDIIPEASFASHAPVSPIPDVSIPGETPNPSATPGPDESGTATEPPAGSGGPGATLKPKNCPATPDLSGWVGTNGTNPAADGRLDILIVGGDSRSDTGLDTHSLRTDSMLLLSVDIADCKAALFSFPRNLGCDARYPTWLELKLGSGGSFDDCLAYLWRDAAAAPDQYPGSDGIGSECQEQFDCERGWSALVGVIQNMAGVSIDGIIAVNLNGFVSLISNLPPQCPSADNRLALPDASGNRPSCYPGIWLGVTDPLVDLPGPCPFDPSQHCAYYNSQQEVMPIDIEPGCYFMDPEYTLAYARSRHQDSDYQRERRQQYVLQSVRKQLDPLGLLPHIPGLLQAAQDNLFMTFSSNDFPFLAQVASRVDADRLYQEDFAPAHLTALGSMDGVQAKVQNIFSEPEPEPTTQQQNNNCPPK